MTLNIDSLPKPSKRSLMREVWDFCAEDARTAFVLTFASLLAFPFACVLLVGWLFVCVLHYVSPKLAPLAFSSALVIITWLIIKGVS